MTKVLIVTRTKNRNTLLIRAIESVKQQTYVDYVHIIFNNGGDMSAVQRIVDDSGSDKITLLNSSETISRARALNEAIRSEDSTYIAVLDDDDTWHPEFLERTISILAKGELHGVVTKIDQVFEKNTDSNLRQVRKQPWMTDLKVISIYQQCIDNQLSTVGFVYTREAYDSVGGYDESLNVLEDYEYGIRFLLKYDVDLLDPGFALANYHRRIIYRKNVADNSFTQDDHRYNFYNIANRFLRQELKEGRLGVGYIMSSIKYEQTYIAQTMRRIMPKIVVNTLKKRAQD